MDDLLKVAVAGTARARVRSGSATAPIDRAVAQLGSHGAERQLLLTAGAYAIRQRAGILPLAHRDASDIADDETWDVAPERMALLVAELLSGQAADLVLEALERLHYAQLLIPPALLPAILDAGTRNKAIRSALPAVIGQRGRWLARRNPDWSWVITPGGGELAGNAETIWQEGTYTERLDVLRLVRSSDPARGRTLLESTWKRERAAFRAEAIDVLSINLSGDDQPFLDAALEDRATTVRERAEEILIRIPGSRPARNAELRAERLIGKRLGVQVVIRAPDGGHAAFGAEQAAAMIQAFSRVPPARWVTFLGKQPSDLVKAIARDRDWGFSVLAGWTRAALTFTDEEWAAALWPVWLTAPPPLGKAANAYARSLDATVNQHLIGLLQVMRPIDAVRVVGDTIAGRFDPVRMSVLLPYLARPWSADFTDRYLRSFRDLADLALKQTPVNWQALNAWTASFQTAIPAIPLASTQGAIALLSQLHDTDQRYGTDNHWERWRQSLQHDIETLRLRQRIHEEIRE